MKHQNILHIVHSLNIGGLEHVVIDLAESFHAKGHLVTICCLSEKGPLSVRAEGTGIRVLTTKKRNGIDPRIPFNLRTLIKKDRFDIIHTHNEAGLVYGTPGALMAGCRNIVHTEHGKEPGYERDGMLQKVEGILLKRVRQVVLVSDRLKETMPSLRKVKEDRIRTVINGIDAERYSVLRHKTKMKIGLLLEPDCFVIGHVARMVPLKNQLFLLSVFEELRKEFSHIKLVIAGDGPSRKDLEAYCIQAGMVRDVHFLGARSDIPEVLSMMDLFMLTSKTEGISITLLEAMAAGIPVMASNVGGTPEIIEHGRNGILLGLGDPRKWVERARELIRSPEERARLSFNGRTSVKRDFSLTAMTDSYEKIYQSLT